MQHSKAVGCCNKIQKEATASGPKSCVWENGVTSCCVAVSAEIKIFHVREKLVKKQDVKGEIKTVGCSKEEAYKDTDCEK